MAESATTRGDIRAGRQKAENSTGQIQDFISTVEPGF